MSEPGSSAAPRSSVERGRDHVEPARVERDFAHVDSASVEPAVAVILVAAGSGTRLGASVPKAFVEVAGVTILERALRQVFGTTQPAQVIVVAPEQQLEQAAGIAADVAGAASAYLTVVAGGDTRQQSVAAGLAHLLDSVEVVLVHDAARALTPSSLFDSVVAAVRSSGRGVVPGLPVADTIKQVDWLGSVERTVDRSQLVAVQTPQGFARDILEASYAAANQEFTDDAAVVAAAGHSVVVSDGDPLAFKITTPWDLARAESLAGPAHDRSSESDAGPTQSRSPESTAQPLGAATDRPLSMRTGIGIDVHAFDAEQPLWLGGLYWPNEPGLSGHSDGDAVSHAVCDALLSAAGLGDIGSRFGTDDPRFAGAHGEVFLTAVAELLAAEGFSVANVAVQIVSNRPKLAPRRAEIEARLSELVGAPVSVSATTSDALGFTGRGEGLSAVATALVSRA